MRVSAWWILAGIAAGCGGGDQDARDAAVADAAADADAAVDAGAVADAAGPDGATGLDRFGVRKIYATAPGGREWFLNASAPEADGVFRVSSATGTAIVRNADGSWRASDKTGAANSGTRLEVRTPTGQTLWKNVEITGYVRLESYSFDEELSWYGRSGNHTASDPCDGTAYHMQLTYAGGVWYQKEVWHTGGYTGRRGELAGVTRPLTGRWVGFKAMIFDIAGGVRNEIWIDGDDTGVWTRVNSVDDTGGWGGGTVSCGRPADYVIDIARPIVAFRADNATWDFRSLSVREIAAP